MLTSTNMHTPRTRYLYKGMSENHPIGRYLITTNGHITSCINGFIIDTWDCTNSKIEHIWKVK